MSSVWSTNCVIQPTLVGSLMFRRVPRSHTATPSLHFGNTSLGQNCTTELEVASPKCDADKGRDPLLETWTHRYRISERRVCKGGT